MFNINNKNTRVSDVVVFLLLTLSIFCAFFYFSIVDFEQLNVSCDAVFFFQVSFLYLKWIHEFRAVVTSSLWWNKSTWKWFDVRKYFSYLFHVTLTHQKINAIRTVLNNLYPHCIWHFFVLFLTLTSFLYLVRLTYLPLLNYPLMATLKTTQWVSWLK